MTEPFDAVLAEMRLDARLENGKLAHDAATGGQLEAWADRLAVAHAAEVEALKESLDGKRHEANAAWVAAEAAERDARLIACALAGAYAALDMESPPATAPLIERYIATTEQADED